MIAQDELEEGFNVLFRERLFSVKAKQTNKVVIRPVSDIGFLETGYDTIDPVPITPAILLQAGFEKMSENIFSFQSPAGHTYEAELISEPRSIIMLKLSGSEIHEIGMILHQLQKAIHAATGELIRLKEES